MFYAAREIFGGIKWRRIDLAGVGRREMHIEREIPP